MYSKAVEEQLATLKAKPGDFVRLTTQKGPFEGKLMPRPELGDSNILVLKMPNGYNVGIKYSKDAKLELLKQGEMPKQFHPTAKANTKLPKVALIYTGGTIGSKVDYASGGVYMLTKPEELLADVPELRSIANLEVKDAMSISSEDMSYMEWQKIAKETAAFLNKGAHGIVITHGTDTMHYTSAALSFMLKNVNAPVVLTGAQRSPDRGSSDAFMNLISSTAIAARSDIAEVGICMHETSSDTSAIMIRGTKARKMHTSMRDAFKPINEAPIARVDKNLRLSYVSDYKKTNAENAKSKVELLDKYEPKTALVKFTPNSNPDIINYYQSKKYKGIIIEGTGLGHAAVSTVHKEFNWLSHIKNAVDSGMIVGMTSQCIHGRVNANVYRNLRLISNAGAVYCEDMTPETAFVKLGFLLGNYKADKAKEMLSENLVGEITERSKYLMGDA